MECKHDCNAAPDVSPQIFANCRQTGILKHYWWHHGNYSYKVPLKSHLAARFLFSPWGEEHSEGRKGLRIFKSSTWKVWGGGARDLVLFCSPLMQLKWSPHRLTLDGSLNHTADAALWFVDTLRGRGIRRLLSALTHTHALSCHAWLTFYGEANFVTLRINYFKKANHMWYDPFFFFFSLRV